MNQAELNREVASVTGESVTTIRDLGFLPLTSFPYERDREPLVVDWDELESERHVLHPISINCCRSLAAERMPPLFLIWAGCRSACAAIQSWSFKHVQDSSD